jgi:hypothetical protein
MPIMYQQNTLQMEWCLNCHRNPAKNLRPTSEIYNMAWTGPSELKPVWCAAKQSSQSGTPTAQDVACSETNPSGAGGGQLAALHLLPTALHGQAASDAGGMAVPAVLNYQKFTSQEELGKFLVGQYNIRTPRDLSSCEVCHR